jgi:general secretion pathway protein L
MVSLAVGEPIVAGLRWWRNELAGMLPRARAHRGDGRSGTLLLDIDDARVTARLRTNDEAMVLASAPRPGPDTSRSAALPALATLADRVDPERTPILVRVPEREVLTRTVHLPPAAAENLREVLAFEMHRRTPFVADAVYFDFRRLPMAPGDQLLRVELTVVRRELVDDVLAMLPFPNLTVAAMTGPTDPDGGKLVLRVTPAHHAPATGRKLTPLLWIANAALLAAVVAVPLVQQGRDIDALREQVAAAKAEAERAVALSVQAESVRAARRFLIDARRHRPALVSVLTELTAILPDTTWVQRLEIKSHRARLIGTSKTAASLIAIIDNSARFRNAAFNAPVTRNPATGSEQFQLVFEINVPSETDDNDNGKNLQKGAGAIAAAGSLRALR